MRQVINISLPESMVQIIKYGVEKGGYASTSEFIRHLIRIWNTENLAKELKTDRKQFKKGKGIELKSLNDLQ